MWKKGDLDCLVGYSRYIYAKVNREIRLSQFRSGYPTQFPLSPEPVVHGVPIRRASTLAKLICPATDSIFERDLFQQTKGRVVDLAESMNVYRCHCLPYLLRQFQVIRLERHRAIPAKV
jgi:hypothetical protein